LLSASSIEKDVKSSDKINKTELSKLVAQKLAKKLRKKILQKFILIEDLINIMVELKHLQTR
jgi:hypothetical protein